MKKKILVFCEYYLPGFRGGGGMRTVANLIERFFHRYDFFVVTRDHDNATDRRPYDSVETGKWNQLSNAQVFYFGKGKLRVSDAASLVGSIKPDIVFLNSVFGMPGRRYLSARRRGLVPDIPLILAPCGELGPGALSIKGTKKRVFLKLSRSLRLYKGVIWKASSEREMAEIRAAMGRDVTVEIAADLLPTDILPRYSQEEKSKKESGIVRFAIVARIDPKKNIHFFLESLRDVTEGCVDVDLIGPVDDQAYWKKCKDIIASLPANISVNFIGALEQEEAIEQMFRSHFFALPSLNENFGYVFIEGLAAGCPLLLSDQTIWNDLHDRNAGWTVPLDSKQALVERIKECVQMNESRYMSMSAAAREYALQLLLDRSSESAMGFILEKALADHSQKI